MKGRLTASQVLDAHRLLREGLDDPATAAHLVTVLSADMASGRPEAHRPFYPAVTGSQALSMLKADLGAARTYQLSSDIVGPVTSAWEEGADGAVWLREQDMPHPAGFAWLDTPVRMRSPDTPDLLVRRAWSWAPGAAAVAGGRAARGVRVAIWHHTSDCDDFWTPRDQAEWLRESGRHRLTFDGAEFAPFGEMISGAGAAAWLHALWAALAAGIPATARPELRKDSKKRFTRHGGGPPEVTVVSLRRPAPADPAGQDPSPRDPVSQDPAASGPPLGAGAPAKNPAALDWEFHWEVDEHHRHIGPYPPGHKASPAPGGDERTCAVCGTRITPVRSHTRGPKDKPLRDRARRVYRA
jgi:hypothetical protein